MVAVNRRFIEMFGLDGVDHSPGAPLGPVVEDDPDVATALRTLLTRAGYQVLAAADGRTGLRRLFADGPDLMVLDIGLPSLDGWQVLERTRDLTDLPVLLLTARGAENDRLAQLAQLGLIPDDFVLATVHRPENTDDPAALRAVLGELAALAAEMPVVLPLHPRTRARAEAAGLAGLLAPLRVTRPLGYRDFLALARHAALLVSDSGGVQEEVTVLGRPLVVVRNSTERPEAMADFATLVAPGPALGRAARERLALGAADRARLAALPSPFGDGRASHRIAGLLAGLVTERTAPYAAAA